MRPNGLFLFNAEINEKEDYVMSESGRFKHSKGYLDQLITQTQFQLLSYQVVRLRTQKSTTSRRSFVFSEEGEPYAALKKFSMPVC